jgi:hypothetical protein
MTTEKMHSRVSCAEDSATYFRDVIYTYSMFDLILARRVKSRLIYDAGLWPCSSADCQSDAYVESAHKACSAVTSFMSLMCERFRSPLSLVFGVLSDERRTQ